jgi:hypothetical protein
MQERLCALKTLLRAVSRLEESIREEYGVTLTEALCLAPSPAAAPRGRTRRGGGAVPSRLSRVLGS